MSRSNLQRRVGENARRLRLKTNDPETGKPYTTAKAAEGLDVDDRYLRRLEAGEFNLGLSTIHKVATFYGVDAHILLKPLRSRLPPRRVGRPIHPVKKSGG